jgi:hypothetical protein
MILRNQVQAMPCVPRAIVGRLLVVLRTPSGPVVARRQAHNAVLRSGAEMLAAMFRGEAGAAPTGFAVGLSDEPPAPPFDPTPPVVLRPDNTQGILRPAAALAPDAMTVTVLAEEMLVRVAVRATLPADAGVSPDGKEVAVDIAEACLGVLAPDGQSLSRIYNRVVFDAVPKTALHELALFWEVDFPYGA